MEKSKFFSTELNGYKYCYLTFIILLNILIYAQSLDMTSRLIGLGHFDHSSDQGKLNWSVENCLTSLFAESRTAQTPGYLPEA